MKKRKSRMTKLPFVFRVFDQKGLVRFPPVEEGDLVECYKCGKNHELIEAVCVRSRSRDSLFLVYKCGKTWRVGAVFGRMVADRRPDNARKPEDE